VPLSRQPTAAVQAIGRIALLERKRRHGRLIVHNACLSEVDRLQEQTALLIVNPALATTRVIESADAVTSMSFTSTSVIARSMCEAIRLFDPTGLPGKDDKYAIGLPILYTQGAL
jgi:polysaccharide biosynthesis PFTS motif protein